MKSIKLWSELDRPREKLLTSGKKSLTDTELLAIILNSGNREKSAVDLARSIMHACNYDVNNLAAMSINDLMEFKGVGVAKAIHILAAFELSARKKVLDVKKVVIKSSEDVFKLMYPLLNDLYNEEFWILLLNRANAVVKQIKLSSGGITGTVVDVRLALKFALEHFAVGMILVHNHPSGNNSPSPQDIQMTKKMKSAAETMDIQILDHVIIARDLYYSFADEGLL